MSGLPDGRITNKEVAEYVASQIAGAREDIREEAAAQQETLRRWIAEYLNSRIDALRDNLKSGEKRFRIEMRTWLACAVVVNTIHPSTITALAAVGASVFGAHLFGRFFGR